MCSVERLAAQHLIAKGHTRCAFIGEQQVSGSVIVSQCQERLQGYRQALAEAGIPLMDKYVSLDRLGVDEARQQTHHLLDLPEPPTAIFAHSDTEAFGTMKAARERGLSIPGDLAVIGFDDLDVADYVGLTTIRQPLVESGHIAIRLLLERLANRSCSGAAGDSAIECHSTGDT